LAHPLQLGLNVLTARIILWGLVLAQLADALTFTIGVSRFGIGLESNGIAAWLYRSGGLESVLVVKGGVLVATIAIIVATAEDFPRLLVWGGAAATSIGLLGFATNTASILILS
jgi:hypothetical protein